MARTKAADYDDKRKLITAKAARLFAREGFASASLSSLAEACGISKSLIYHYYPSKEAILFDVMNEHMDELLAAIDEARDGGGAPGDIIKRFTRALMRRYTGAADQQKVLLYELNALPEREGREIIEKQRRLIAFVEKLLSDASRVDDDEHALGARTMLYFGMLNWTHTWFKPAGPVSRDAVADMAADLVLARN